MSYTTQCPECRRWVNTLPNGGLMWHYATPGGMTTGLCAGAGSGSGSPPPQTPPPSGVIVTAALELSMLARQLELWRDGKIETYDMAGLVRRTGRKLDRACWCDEGVCCSVHGRHVGPHVNCPMR